MMAFDRMKNILAGYADKGVDFVSKKLNPELRGVNALAASFSLLVMADRVAEEEEKEAVSEFLIDMDIVIEKGLIREVSELFLHHIDRLEVAQKKNAMEFNIVVGEILKDVAAVKDDPEYRGIVADTVTLVTSGGSADAKEIKTRERILKVLGK